MKYDFGGGKYTVQLKEDTGDMSVKSDTVPWRYLKSNGLVRTMLQDYDAQRRMLAQANLLLNHAESFIAGFTDDELQVGVGNLHEAIVKHLTDSPFMPEIDAINT